MNDITDIFDTEIQGSTPEDLDTEIAASAQWLSKIAEAEGVDLDSLPAADVADLIIKVSAREPQPTETSTDDQQTKEASMSTENEITNADVSRELFKAAAAEGIDINEVSKEEYDEAWNKMAHAMLQPDWSEKKAEAEKKAADDKAAYDTGVKIAQGFIDAVNGHFDKKAEDGDMPPFVKKDDKKDDKKKSDEEDSDEGSSKESALAANAPATGGDAEVEALALKIARQTLIDNGIDPDSGEKLSAEQQKVAAAEQRAAEILKEKGWL